MKAMFTKYFLQNINILGTIYDLDNIASTLWQDFQDASTARQFYDINKKFHARRMPQRLIGNNKKSKEIAVLKF